jgi:hypothetical protein
MPPAAGARLGAYQQTRSSSLGEWAVTVHGPRVTKGLGIGAVPVTKGLGNVQFDPDERYRFRVR